MENDSGEKTRELPIRPLEIPGEIQKIPVSEIKPGKIQEKSIEMSGAVVAYFDVLGFSNKTDPKDIEMTLMDFSGPLTLAAIEYPKVRFNVFSDCAFVATQVENAADLLSAIRFAFSQWIADSILVRGGIALGTYSETHSVALDMASKNFVGRLFSGTAVVEAVRLEESGRGALLFASEDCAKFYNRKYHEPIFTLKNDKIVGWSDQDSTLYWFVGISMLRLLRLLSLKSKLKHSATEYLLNNIRYSIAATDSLLPRFLVFAILSLPTIPSRAREKAIHLLKIKDPNDFAPYKKLITDWLKQEKKIKLLEFLAYSDSSIPGP